MMSEGLKKELEMLKMQSDDGFLHPETVVEYARNHQKSELHGQFEWDDSVAAEKYRLNQARILIRVTVTVISNGNDHFTTRLFANLSTKPPENGYHTTEEVLTDPESRRKLILRILAQINGLLNTYPILEFKNLRKAVMTEVNKYTRIPYDPPLKKHKRGEFSKEDFAGARKI